MTLDSYIPNYIDELERTVSKLGLEGSQVHRGIIADLHAEIAWTLGARKKVQSLLHWRHAFWNYIQVHYWLEAGLCLREITNSPKFSTADLNPIRSELLLHLDLLEGSDLEAAKTLRAVMDNGVLGEDSLRALQKNSLFWRSNRYLWGPKLPLILIAGSRILRSFEGQFLPDCTSEIIRQLSDIPGVGLDQQKDTWRGVWGVFKHFGVAYLHPTDEGTDQLLLTPLGRRLALEQDSFFPNFLFEQIFRIQYPNPLRPRSKSERDAWGNSGVVPAIAILGALMATGPTEPKRLTYLELVRHVLRIRSTYSAADLGNSLGILARVFSNLGVRQNLWINREFMKINLKAELTANAEALCWQLKHTGLFSWSRKNGLALKHTSEFCEKILRLGIDHVAHFSQPGSESEWFQFFGEVSMAPFSLYEVLTSRTDLIELSGDELFFQLNRNQLAMEYPQRYLAIVDRNVVAGGETREDATKSAASKGFRQAFVAPATPVPSVFFGPVWSAK